MRKLEVFSEILVNILGPLTLELLGSGYIYYLQITTV